MLHAERHDRRPGDKTRTNAATRYSASARVPRLYGPEQACWARPLALSGHVVSLSAPEIATQRDWFVWEQFYAARFLRCCFHFYESTSKIDFGPI